MNAPIAPEAGTATTTDPALQVPVGEHAYNEIVRFLYTEAAFLDQDRFQEWLGLLDNDLDYRAPVRETRDRRDGRGFSTENFHFLEDRDSLTGRVFRIVGTTSAWAEDPPSRCLRQVTNILVRATDRENEYEVANYLLLIRKRFNETRPEFIAAERHDRLRRTDAGWRLARRTILLQDTVLGTPNLAVFL